MATTTLTTTTMTTTTMTTTTMTTATTTTRRVEARRGAAAALPLVVGYAPFALVVGNAIAQHAVPMAGWTGIWTIVSGSALLATITALDSGSAAIAALTGVLLNARLGVYSASLRTPWARQPRWFKAVAALLLIDPTWAIAEQRVRAPGTDADRRAHFLGAALTLLVGWATMISIGALLGSTGGAVDHLGVTVPLCLVALVAPRLREHDTRPTVVLAACVAFVSLTWPSGTGVLAAVAAGAVVGATGRRDVAGARP